jgi:glutathione S-transferase
MAQLRIFSYLPNPRIWKATIAARLNGVEVEVRGARPRELRDWLWDFEARPLSPGEREAFAASVRVGKVGFKGGALVKTDAFLAAHPFGTVPAAFSPDGLVGIFESNSIMRTVARLGADRVPLYGRDAYEASRIDSFLDASLVFARDTQHYLLALGDEDFPAHVHGRAAEAFAVYIAGIDQALAPRRSFLVGEQLTLADICFVAELCLFSNERLRRPTLGKRGLAPILSVDWEQAWPRAGGHFRRLAGHPAFAPDVRPYLQKLEEGRGDRINRQA